jgi:hypothetical protein
LRGGTVPTAVSDEADPWPDEPDDPEEGPDHPGQQFLERFEDSDPERDLAPEPPTPEGGAPSGLVRAFWGLVATVNLGLFAASLGLMLIGFRGQLREGGAVFLLGVAALGYAGLKYRRYQDRDWDAEADDEAAADDGTEEPRPTDD